MVLVYNMKKVIAKYPFTNLFDLYEKSNIKITKSPKTPTNNEKKI